VYHKGTTSESRKNDKSIKPGSKKQLSCYEQQHYGVKEAIYLISVIHAIQELVIGSILKLYTSGTGHHDKYQTDYYYSEEVSRIIY